MVRDQKKNACKSFLLPWYYLPSLSEGKKEKVGGIMADGILFIFSKGLPSAVRERDRALVLQTIADTTSQALCFNLCLMIFKPTPSPTQDLLSKGFCLKVGLEQESY